MTAAAERPDAPFEGMRARAQAARGGEASFGEMVALAETAAESMQAFFATVDRTVYRELREIADYITTMRSEIALLSAGELKANRLPRAGEHLGAIVRATEDATNSIMESAEAMLAADGLAEAEYKALVADRVMAIFEACSFQDLTGQRIARVVETLEHVEARIGRFAAAVNCDGGTGSAVEDPREKRARELLLHGPQSHGAAIAQTEVDALMAAPAARAAG